MTRCECCASLAAKIAKKRASVKWLSNPASFQINNKTMGLLLLSVLRGLSAALPMRNSTAANHKTRQTFMPPSAGADLILPTRWTS
eukprot:CAMPEP_0174871842 /NCGR_PEP_ID=MMETSP1114-20130205/72240_1 /TAXON_ID=312471 /ORGANISM="Neobodo designis, Strain CCAP 1951/1" /LENGTH=85 /DNA_ID=CAMNT_0016107133 /DNA_START=31 /DNA_END=285 /DNA_ORIENTATION=-